MKPIVLSCLAALCFALNSRADLTVIQTLQGAGPVSEISMRIKGDKARIDATPEVSTIIDGKTGEMLNLMVAQKKFMRISGEKVKAMAQMTASADDGKKESDTPKLVATGRKETINGFPAQEYTCETPQLKASYWITTQFPNSASVLQQMQRIEPAQWQGVKKGIPKLSDFPGLPIRSAVKFESQPEVVTTIKTVSETSLPESDFVVPAGFEEMKMPDISSLMKPGEAKPEKAKKP